MGFKLFLVGSELYNALCFVYNALCFVRNALCFVHNALCYGVYSYVMRLMNRVLDDFSHCKL